MDRGILATMITSTTYGTWLPGDLRGYVENATILPGDHDKLSLARARMNDEPVYLTDAEQITAFNALRTGAAQFGYELLAGSIESWHMHWLVRHGNDDVEVMVGRLKNAVRKAVNRGRIWTAGYDARYCFNETEIAHRTAYIQRHRGHRPL